MSAAAAVVVVVVVGGVVDVVVVVVVVVVAAAVVILVAHALPDFVGRLRLAGCGLRFMVVAHALQCARSLVSACVCIHTHQPLHSRQ